MQIRDRIKSLRRVKASELRPNPRNWRTHPQAQQDALRGALAEIGYADAILVRELPDGDLEIVDGHLRAETTPDQKVPVLVLDVTEEEAAKLLVTLDPLAAMADANEEALGELLETVQTDNAGLQSMLDDLAAQYLPAGEEEEDEEPGGTMYVEATEWRVIVRVKDEEAQASLLARLEAEGYECQPLMS